MHGLPLVFSTCHHLAGLSTLPFPGAFSVAVQPSELVVPRQEHLVDLPQLLLGPLGHLEGLARHRQLQPAVQPRHPPGDLVAFELAAREDEPLEERQGAHIGQREVPMQVRATEILLNMSLYATYYRFMIILTRAVYVWSGNM